MNRFDFQKIKRHNSIGSRLLDICDEIIEFDEGPVIDFMERWIKELDDSDYETKYREAAKELNDA